MEKTRSTNIPVQGIQEALNGVMDVNQVSSIMFQSLFTFTTVARQNNEIYGPKYLEVQNILKKLALNVGIQLDMDTNRKDVVKFHNKILNNYLYLVTFFDHKQINDLFDVLKYEFINFRIKWYWANHQHSSRDSELTFIKELKFSNTIVG